MDFVDKTLVQLSDASSRAALFSEQALEQILNAGYNTDIVPVNAPFTATFDEFSLTYLSQYPRDIEGTISTGGGNEPMQLRIRTAELLPSNNVTADALWRGNIVARSAPEDSVIDEVVTSRPQLSNIDSSIIADMGSLPGDPVVLEQKRREKFLSALKSSLKYPDALRDENITVLLEDLDAASVTELLESGTNFHSALRIGFSAPSGKPPTPQLYPITAAILIRDTGFSVRNLLTESKRLQKYLEQNGLQRPRIPSLPIRKAILVVWIVPDTVFDDEDWPGATPAMTDAQKRAARADKAGIWLAGEGIGLVPVSTSG